MVAVLVDGAVLGPHHRDAARASKLPGVPSEVSHRDLFGVLLWEGIDITGKISQYVELLVEVVVLLAHLLEGLDGAGVLYLEACTGDMLRSLELVGISLNVGDGALIVGSTRNLHVDAGIKLDSEVYCGTNTLRCSGSSVGVDKLLVLRHSGKQSKIGEGERRKHSLVGAGVVKRHLKFE